MHMVYISGINYVTESLSGWRKGQSLWIDILCKNNDIWQDKITAIEIYQGIVLWKNKEEKYHFWLEIS